METPKTEEQKVSVKKEGDGAEAPKKKKNIIRVYHAQNASDGGKNRKKPAGEKATSTGHTSCSTGTAGSESRGTCKGSTEARSS